jgi:hypothetical protein
LPIPTQVHLPDPSRYQQRLTRTLAEVMGSPTPECTGPVGKTLDDQHTAPQSHAFILSTCVSTNCCPQNGLPPTRTTLNTHVQAQVTTAEFLALSFTASACLMRSDHLAAKPRTSDHRQHPLPVSWTPALEAHCHRRHIVLRAPRSTANHM